MEPGSAFERVGRYELIRKIATGGMAELFVARFTGPGGFEKRCALKRILPQFAEDAEFSRMFLQEARLAALFDHPNVAQVFDFGTEETSGQQYMAMELINGIDVRHVVRLVREKGTACPPELAAYIIAQALDGLAYAHEFRDESGRPLNLVHRDVSPQNILVSFDGAVKLVDFGIVKSAVSEHQTQNGMLKGKIAYMSPEQATGEPLDARTDVFSSGVCLYELITGVRPFRAATEIMTLRAILEQDPQPITQFVPECPIGIENAVYRALAKSTAQRHPSAREFQRELQTVLRSCPVPIDRHVVSSFVKSLTEAETVRFNGDEMKIPRGTEEPVRFAGGGAPINVDEQWRAEAARAFELALGPSPRRRTGDTPAVPLDLASLGVPPASTNPGATLPMPTGPRSLTGGRPPDAPASPLAPPVGVHTTDSGVFSREALDASGQVAPSVTRGRILIGLALVTCAVLGLAVMRQLDPQVGSVQPLDDRAAAAPPENPGPGSPVTPGSAASRGASSPPAPSPTQAPAMPPPVAQASATPSPAEASARPASDPATSPAASPRAARPTERDDPRPTRREREEARREAKDARDAKKDRGRPQGKLTLTSIPRGLEVRTGGRLLGVTPLESVALPAGKHTLELAQAKSGIQRTLVVDIEVGAEARHSVQVGKGKLRVNARPWADVSIDGASVGKTPLEVSVYEGKHEVRLTNPEAGERAVTVQIAAGEEKPVLVKF